jgi:hypothetical protein
MATCQERIRVKANLEVGIDITVDGRRTVQPKLAFPPFDVREVDPTPSGLNNAGAINKTTSQTSATGRISNLIFALPGTPTVSGSITTKLSLVFAGEFFTDCAGPYCLKGRIYDVRAEVHFETKAGVDLTTNTHTFPPSSWDGGCRPPDWVLCCSETGVDLDLELDEFEVADSSAALRIELDGEARMDYEIWGRAPGSKAEASTSTYSRARTLPDGGVEFALRRESVRVVVPLPAGLGGGEVTIEGARGTAVVVPGPIEGNLQQLAIRSLDLRAAAVVLPGGKSSGENRVMLAPGQESEGWIDLASGIVHLRLREIIVNDLFDLDHPIRVDSQLVGLYDAATGDVRLLGSGRDRFPPPYGEEVESPRQTGDASGPRKPPSPPPSRPGRRKTRKS